MFAAVLVATSCAALPGTDRRTGIALPQFGLARRHADLFWVACRHHIPGWRSCPVDAGSWSEEWAAVTDPPVLLAHLLYKVLEAGSARSTVSLSQVYSLSSGC